MKKRIVFAFCLVLWMMRGEVMAESGDDILVVANNAVPITSLTLSEVQDIFLKERVYWRSSIRAVPVNAPEGSAIRNEFRRRVLKMTASDEQRFWEQRKIKSGDTAPPQFSNLLKAVFKLSQSVGYVYRSEYKPGVAKILLAVSK